MTSYPTGGLNAPSTALPLCTELGDDATKSALNAMLGHLDLSITTSLGQALNGDADYYLWHGEHPQDDKGRYWVRGLLRSSDLPVLLAEGLNASVTKAKQEGRPIPTMTNAIESFRRFRTGWSNKWVAYYVGVVVEIDHLTRAEQERRYAAFAAATGLRWTLQVFSGGKSVHAYFAFSAPLRGDDPLVDEIHRLLWAIFEGDTTVGPGGLSRLPGWDGPLRKQPIVHMDPTAHDDPQYLRDTLATYAAGMGIADVDAAVHALILAKRLDDAAKAPKDGVRFAHIIPADATSLVARIRATRGMPADEDLALASSGARVLRLAAKLHVKSEEAGCGAGAEMWDHADHIRATWAAVADVDLDLAAAMLGEARGVALGGTLRGTGRKGDPYTYFCNAAALEPYRNLAKGSSHLPSPGCCDDSECATYHDPGASPVLYCYSCGHRIKAESSVPPAVRDATGMVTFGFDGAVSATPATPTRTENERVADALVYLEDRRQRREVERLAKDEATRSRIAANWEAEAAEDKAARDPRWDAYLEAFRAKKAKAKNKAKVTPKMPVAQPSPTPPVGDGDEGLDHALVWASRRFGEVEDQRLSEEKAAPHREIVERAANRCRDREKDREAARRVKMRSAGLTELGKHCLQIHQSLIHVATGDSKQMSHSCRGINCIACGPKVIERKAAAITMMPIARHGEIVGRPLGERDAIYEIRLPDRKAFDWWRSRFSEAKSKSEPENTEIPNTNKRGGVLGISVFSPPDLLFPSDEAHAYVAFEATQPLDPTLVSTALTRREEWELGALADRVHEATDLLAAATSKRDRAKAQAAVNRAARAFAEADAEVGAASKARAAYAASTVVILSTLPVRAARDRQFVTVWGGEAPVQDRVDELADWISQVEVADPVLQRHRIIGSITSSHGLSLDPDTIYGAAHPSSEAVERARITNPGRSAAIAKELGLEVQEISRREEDGLVTLVVLAPSKALTDLPTRMRFLAALEKGEVDSLPSGVSKAAPDDLDTPEMQAALAELNGGTPRQKEAG